MRLLPKKMTFQLTPLLDLLLIVIFAQYMEMQQASTKAETRAEKLNDELKDDLADAQSRLKRSQNEADRRRRESQAARDQLAEFREAAEKLRKQLQAQQQTSSDELKRALAQRDVVGKLMSELFRIPASLVEKALEPLSKGDADRTPAEIARLRETVRQMAAKRDREIVEHILKFEELRKWADIWELHVDRTGVATVKMGKHTERIIVRDQGRPIPDFDDFDKDVARTAKEFEQKLFNFYKQHRQSLSQAKTVVIIFVTYDELTINLYRKPAIVGVREAAERMRADTGGRPRFEYAILGMIRDEPGSTRQR